MSSAKDGKGGTRYIWLGDVALAAKFQGDAKDMKAVRSLDPLLILLATPQSGSVREDRAKTRERALWRRLPTKDGDGMYMSIGRAKAVNKMLESYESLLQEQQEVRLASRRSLTRNAMAESFRERKLSRRQEARTETMTRQ